MKRILLFIYFLFVSIVLPAQLNVDSLFTIWSDSSSADTLRLNAIGLLCNQIIRNQPDSAYLFAQEMLELAEEKNLKKYQAEALLNQARTMSFKGLNDNKLIDLSNRSYLIYKELGNDAGAAHALSNIGGLYSERGQYVSALEYLMQSLSFSIKSGSKYHTSNILHIIGEAYMAIDSDEKALEYLLKGLKEAEEGNLNRETSQALKDIGNLYLRQGDYKRAEDYSKRALRLALETKVKREIAGALSTVGMTRFFQGDYLGANDYFQRSLKLHEEIGNKDDAAKMLIQIGLVYKEQGDNQQAFNYLDRALMITKEVEASLNYPTIYNAKGSIYYSLGNFNEAIYWCKEGLLAAEKLSKILEQSKSCTCLYQSHKSLKQGNQALQYHERFLLLSDSLQSEETGKKLQQMEFAKLMLADSLKQEEENLVVQMSHEAEVRKKNKTRNVLLGSGIMVLLIAGGLWNRLSFMRKSRAVIQKEKDRSENLLLNILPAEVAEELKQKGEAVARDYEMVSILFTDFKGFTEASEKLSAGELVGELNHCFKAFDAIMEKYGIEKIKTIGDSYMAAGGLPVLTDDSTKNTIKAALKMQAFITERKATQDVLGLLSFEMRVGIHTGPVVAGIVGDKKFQYDIWGDSVNTASRMESSGEIGKVNISQDTYEQIKDEVEFSFENRGKIKVKGKGEIEMYFVSQVLDE